MNRGSLTRAVYIGVLCAFFPLPGQMPLAIAGALIFRANIPMSVALTWLTNPVTAIPVFWFAYYVGAWFTSEPPIGLRTIGRILADLSLWILGDAANPFLVYQFFSFKAFLIGLLICALVTSLVLGLAFRIGWQLIVTQDWQKRHGYNANAPKFRSQKGHKAREASQDDDFSI